MRGLCNVVIPSYTLDLKRLNEKGIRHDIRRELELGFWATLLVSETAVTVPEYRQFIQWAHDEAKGKLKLVHHAGFNTLEENIEAVQMACAKAGWQVKDVELFELNEAFASQSLADSKGLGIDLEKVNVHGGAIALGHPLGSSGARVLTTLVHAMKRRGARKGVAALCLGGGNAVAVCVEGV